MPSTTFSDYTTVVSATWLNDVNGVVWTLFGGTTSPSAARTALGLGTIATQAANNVAITGGTITGLGSPLPLLSGGTGETTATGTGAIVKQTSPTITTPTISGTCTISGAVTQTVATGGDFISFASSVASAEPSMRIDATQTTSGISLKLSNSGLNKQFTLRGDGGGGFTTYINQAAGGASTSGTSAFSIDASGVVLLGGTTPAPTNYTTLGDLVLPSSRKVRAKNTAKVQCTFTVSGTTVTLSGDSYNCVAPTRNGAGDYTLTFSTALTNANYTVAGSARGNGGACVWYEDHVTPTRTTTTVRLKFVDFTPNNVDPAFASFVIIGD